MLKMFKNVFKDDLKVRRPPKLPVGCPHLRAGSAEFT